jgi:hypothetical protein
MSLLRALLLLGVGGGILSGCVMEERPVRPPRACVGGVWIRGHYGPRGVWHPGHWRCPGVVEVVEID